MEGEDDASAPAFGPDLAIKDKVEEKAERGDDGVIVLILLVPIASAADLMMSVRMPSSPAALPSFSFLTARHTSPSVMGLSRMG